MRELRVEDALMYLDQVKMEFGDRPHIYNEFLDIMKTFKSQAIDTPGVIRRVASLFHGNKRLVLGFNTFLPEGYRIELPLDGSAWPVYREPGRSGVIAIAPPPGGIPGVGGPGGGGGGPGGGGPGGGGGPPGPGGPHGPPPAGAMGRGGPPPPPGSMGRGGLGPPPPAGARLGPPPPGAMGRPGSSGPPHPHGPPPPPGAMGRGGMRGPVPGPFPGPGGGMMKGPPGGGPGGMGRGMGPPPPGSGPGPMGRGMGPPVGAPGGGAPGLKPPPGPGPTPPGATLSMASAGAGPMGAPPPGAQLQQQQQQQPPPAAAAAGGAPGQQPLEGTAKQPVEFDHAINYVTTIKKRFASKPEIYRKFLEILHTYQKEQRGIKEVLDEVSLLFADHADLLKEFTYFLPDAVQSQAKAQLDVAAKKAEERMARRAAMARHDERMAKKRADADAGAESAAASAPSAESTTVTRGRTSMVLPPAPPPPPTSGSRYSSSGQMIQHPSPQPTVPSHVVQVPFGATKGRSEDREKEITRGAVHGVVSFGAVRPPRRNELSPAQAAQLFGRPTTIPRTPIQPMTSESAFFERVKSHFLRRDLFPDKPIVNRKQTPYMEFIKCLHLFGSGILNKDELIQLLRGLFIQGNTPKSGANASTNATNIAAMHAAMALLSEFEKILTGRGPFAHQEQNKRFKAKYGSFPLREYDLGDGGSGGSKVTPSYWKYPADYPADKIMGGESSEYDRSVLNYECFSMAPDWTAAESKGDKRLFKSPEDYDGIKVRRNVYEEVLARVEDEMHEVDMAIERNASAMNRLEPVSEEATRLREQEEKDGQPIGRMQYKLRMRTLNSIHVGAIARVYGEAGEEVLQHLLRNPLVVVPIVFKRLKEKDEEWRKVKKELVKEWKKAVSENLKGSLDVKCFVYKEEIEKSFSVDRLLEECQKAKSLAKHPSKIQRHPATNMIIPDFHLMNPEPELALFQPHLSVLVSKNMPHKHAHDLLMTHLARSSSDNKELFSKVWANFVAPWFGLPSSWDESGNLAEKGGMSTVFTPGQRVRTSVGDGQIVSVFEGKTPSEFRYLVKFAFGVGYVKPRAIAHLLPATNTSSDMDTSPDSDASKLMTDDIQIMFGTEKIYIFVRLYILLVTMLYQAKDILDNRKSAGTAGYASFMSSLEQLIQGKIEAKDFEADVRKNVEKDVYNFVAIPPLVEKCSESLVKMAREDLLENLYSCSQLKLKDLNQLRSLSLNMTQDALYRLQIQLPASQVFFSYLPIDTELQLSNPLDVKPPEPTEAIVEKPPETDAKRPLETTNAPDAKMEDVVAEPEQKRMKTEEAKPENPENKPEDKKE